MEIPPHDRPRVIQEIREALEDHPVFHPLPSHVVRPSLTPTKGSTADCPPDLLAQLARFEHLFIVPTEKLKEITARFVTELEKGLTVEGGDIPMLPTWCMACPTGEETGTYLAIDMGGSNLRVCEI